jgi:hypothetical protein
MLGGALGLATANHKQLLNPNSPIDLEAWRDALLQSTKNQVRKASFFADFLALDVCFPCRNCFTIMQVAGAINFYISVLSLNEVKSFHL